MADDFYTKAEADAAFDAAGMAAAALVTAEGYADAAIVAAMPLARVLEDVHSDFYPDDSDCAWPEPLSILTTNKLYHNPVMRIDFDRTNTTALTIIAGFYFSFKVPADYDNGATLRIRWVSSKTTGDVRFYCKHNPVAASGESVDPAAAAETVGVTASTDGTAWHINTTDVPLTGLAAGDQVLVFLGNDGTHAADTLAGARILLNVAFVYNAA